MKLATGEKRLFWISIIIVELALFYVVWRPPQARFTRLQHRAALPPAAVQPPEPKPTAIVVPSRKHWNGRHWPGNKPPVVNASLKTPEPIPAAPMVVPQAALSPLETFWCHIAAVQAYCDCQASNEQASNLVRQTH